MLCMSFIDKCFNNDTKFINLRFFSLGFVSFIICPVLLSYLGSMYHNLFLNGSIWFISCFVIPSYFINWFDLDFLPCYCSRKIFSKYKSYVFKTKFF